MTRRPEALSLFDDRAMPGDRTPTGARSMVAIYADESCIGNGREGDNPGGAAGLVEYRASDGQLTLRDYWISEPATTNNRMALRSVIEAFQGLSAMAQEFDVVFTSDSKYIVLGMSQWMPGWRARGWKRKGGEIMNLELWKQAADVVRGHRVHWRWVKGHNAQPQNEYANDLAVLAAKTLTGSRGFQASGFDDWLAIERARGRIRRDPDPFPDATLFG